MSIPEEEYPLEWQGMTRGQCVYIYELLELQLPDEVKVLFCMPRKVDDMSPSLPQMAGFLRNMANKMDGGQ